MRVKVVKEFLFAKDGQNAEMQRPPADIEIPDAVVPGLEEEGYVRRVSADRIQRVEPVKQAATPEPVVETNPTPSEEIAETRNIEAEDSEQSGSVEPAAEEPAKEPQIEIPEGWRTLKFFAVKSLAQKISGRDIRDADDARQIIEDELKKRQG